MSHWHDHSFREVNFAKPFAGGNGALPDQRVARWLVRLDHDMTPGHTFQLTAFQLLAEFGRAVRA